MDLGLTEVQQMLRQTCRDFAEHHYPVSRHRELLAAGRTFDEETWRKIAALGWPGLVVPEAYGGSGGCWVELVVLLEEMGRALMPYQFLSHSLAGLLLRDYGDEEQKRVLLPQIAAGEPVFAVAITEARATLDEAGIQCRAGETGQGYILNGAKHFVRGAGAAGRLLVLARLSGSLAIFLVNTDSPGVSIAPLHNIGDDDQAKVELVNVSVPGRGLLGGQAYPWDALARIVAMGALIECGYGVGIMSRDIEMTVNYVRDRVQFGQPIGAFQAVQHQVADQATDVDCARYLTFYAAWAMDWGLPTALVEVGRAKAWVSDALRRVARTGNQLHGGIGYSREYDLHFYYQRAKTSELMFGQADEHRERIAKALLDD